MIRLQDGDLAFELHQRLIEAEASFEELAMAYSEGPERTEQGRIGPVPLSQPHPLLMNVLRTSQPGQIRDPLLINDTWVIVRLDQWNGARLDDATRERLLEELFESWIHQRAAQLLRGESPEPLPLHRLRSNVLHSNTPVRQGIDAFDRHRSRVRTTEPPTEHPRDGSERYLWRSAGHDRDGPPHPPTRRAADNQHG